jgi:uncharacterized protein
MWARASCLKSCCNALDGLLIALKERILKYIVVILVVLLGVWLWRKNRVDTRDEARDEGRKDSQQTPRSPSQSTTHSTEPQIMLSCAVCGVHLPRSDAHVGKRGSYCSATHQKQREG